jgi:hypothetical protein
MENRTESCCFWDHFIIHCLLEIVRNHGPKKVKRTESCFTAREYPLANLFLVYEIICRERKVLKNNSRSGND